MERMPFTLQGFESGHYKILTSRVRDHTLPGLLQCAWQTMGCNRLPCGPAALPGYAYIIPIGERKNKTQNESRHIKGSGNGRSPYSALLHFPVCDKGEIREKKIIIKGQNESRLRDIWHQVLVAWSLLSVLRCTGWAYFLCLVFVIVSPTSKWEQQVLRGRLLSVLQHGTRTGRIRLCKLPSVKLSQQITLCFCSNREERQVKCPSVKVTGCSVTPLPALAHWCVLI